MLIEAQKHLFMEEVIQSKRSLNRRESNLKNEAKRHQNGIRGTPLNVARSEVLRQIEDCNIIKKPIPISTPQMEKIRTTIVNTMVILGIIQIIILS